jgi:hypothetical protein
MARRMLREVLRAGSKKNKAGTGVGWLQTRVMMLTGVIWLQTRVMMTMTTTMVMLRMHKSISAHLAAAVGWPLHWELWRLPLLAFVIQTDWRHQY